MKSKNRFRESVSYRRTGDPNIIERVHVSYIDVGRLKRRIAEIDKELKALPRPKEPPSREEFEKDYRIPGCSYDEFVELTMMRNEYLQSAAERQALEEEKQRLEAKIDKLKQMATERE
ncbi:MAG: hypothetical protein DRP85_04210 [Candidatus Makaraimicrobium thalassicum]|nr:MAG: hypothetical protein DRP85_04210 [Candidatus Omnitrophota bacterium]